MRLNLLVLLITILFGAGITLWLDQDSTPPTLDVSTSQNTTENSGEVAPDFTAIDIHGKPHQLRTYKGKTIILNFWATWCTPCVIEFPKLIKLAKDNPDSVILALSSDTTDESITRFLAKQKSSIPKNMVIARDAKRKITADIFKTYKLPETIIISPSGHIVKKIVGDTDWNGSDIKAFLKALN